MVAQVRLWPEISFGGTFRLRSSGEFGFRFWNPDFGLCNRTRNRQTDFTSEKSVPKGGLQLRNPNPDFMDFPFTVQLGNPKKVICKTILVNSGLLFTNYACACRTAVPKDSFSNPFSDFPIERWKGKSKNKYFSVEVRFRISCSIANPKSGF